MSAFSGLAEFVQKSKKDKRLESKKNKALAFLKLIQMRHANSAEESLTRGPPAKKARQDGSSNSRNIDPAFLCSTTQSSLTKESEGDTSAAADYARAKEALRLRQKLANKEYERLDQHKKLKYGPEISLKLENLLPFHKFHEARTREQFESRLPPLFVTDLQHLLLLALMKSCSWTPRWCYLKRPKKLTSVVLIVIKDISIEDFKAFPDSFPFLMNSFSSCVEMVSPCQYNSCLDKEMSAVPLTISQMKRYTKRKDVHDKIVQLISKCSGNLNQENIHAHSGDNIKCGSSTVESAPSHEKSKILKAERQECKEEDDEFPRTSLLLSTAQLIEEGYPMPIDTRNKLYADYEFSKNEYVSTTLSSPIFGVDCEMCQTSGEDFELTRVSIVNEKSEVVYDELVKPHKQIINYLTKYSGMTEELLEPVTKRVDDVRREIRDLLPADAILCGQSLWNDLNALKLFHPYVIDTSVIYNQSGDKRVKCGLRKLAFNFLGQTIQDSDNGHCSIEDAKAAMDLVKLKLKKDIEFGDALLGGVYFPDIKTYFKDPSKAQNVEESFTSHHMTMEYFPHCSQTDSSANDKKNTTQLFMKSSCVENEGSLVSRENDLSQAENTRNSEKEDVKKIDANSKGASIEREQQEQNGESHQQRENVTAKEVFFQQEGSTIKFSFFEVLADNMISAGLVGCKDLVCKIQTQTELDCIVVENNSDACVQASRLHCEKDFTWLELGSSSDSIQFQANGVGNEYCPTEQRKHLLSALDEQVRQFVTRLQEKTLVSVVMAGRFFEGKHFNAATFVKVTSAM